MEPSKKLIILISGKRKCGKDFVANSLELEFTKCGVSVCKIHLSEPLKRTFAQMAGLDAEELLKSTEYKEKYRRHVPTCFQVLLVKD